MQSLCSGSADSGLSTRSDSYTFPSTGELPGSNGEGRDHVSESEAPVHPEEKPQILEEARQPNTTVAQVLRRRQVDATTFYRWKQQAKDAVREAMGRDRRRTEADAKDREIERLRADLVKKSRIIAEVIEENLDLKTNCEPGHADAVFGEAEGRCTSGRERGGRAYRLECSPKPVATAWRRCCRKRRAL